MKMEVGVENLETLSSQIDILHPELLSKEGIIRLLSEKCHLKVDNAELIEKGELVSLFQQTVMPLPQRAPRNNRRGKRTKAVIKRLDAKRPKPVEKSTEYQNPKRSPQVKTGLLISSDLNLTSGTRLKPPPIVINKKRAILKLGSSLPASVAHIRTGVAKVNITNKPVGDGADKSQHSPHVNQKSAGRTMITFSKTNIDSKEGKQVGAIKCSVTPPVDQKQGLGAKAMRSDKTVAPKRNYITFGGEDQKSPASRLQVSGKAKDAVRKALTGATDGNHKVQITKRTPVEITSKNNETAGKKRQKITWP